MTEGSSVQISAATIQSKAEKVGEAEILRIISNFKDRMLETSDNFVKQLDQALNLSEQKEILEIEAEEYKILYRAKKSFINK